MHTTTYVRMYIYSYGLQVQELQEKADTAMMLKFGKLVDLDLLEGVYINRKAEELRSKIEAVESGKDKALAELEVRM